MKKIILVAVLIFGISSCTTVDEVITQNDYTSVLAELNNSNEMSEFGVGHNAVLGAVLEDTISLKAVRAVDNSYDALKKNVYKHLVGYAKQTRGIVEGSNVKYESYDSIYDKSQSLIQGKAVNDISFTSGFVSDSITHNQKVFLQRLEDICEDDDFDIKSILNRIKLLETESLTTLSIEERKLFLLSTSVAANTSVFWYEYVQKQKVTRSKFNPNWKQAGKADIAGAVGGAAACGVARLFGPIGWKAWAIGIIGGAVGNSVTDLASQALDHYW